MRYGNLLQLLRILMACQRYMTDHQGIIVLVTTWRLSRLTRQYQLSKSIGHKPSQTKALTFSEWVGQNSLLAST